MSHPHAVGHFSSPSSILLSWTNCLLLFLIHVPLERVGTAAKLCCYKIKSFDFWIQITKHFDKVSYIPEIFSELVPFLYETLTGFQAFYAIGYNDLWGRGMANDKERKTYVCSLCHKSMNRKLSFERHKRNCAEKTQGDYNFETIKASASK